MNKMQPFDLFLLVVIYGAGFVVLLFWTRMVRAAGEAADREQTARRLNLGLWIWPVLATVYALNTGTGIVWFGLSFLVPFGIGTGLLFTQPVRQILTRVSIPGLVGLQVYRNAGAVFLIAYFFTESDLSREFAVNAGWGDILHLTGVLAIPVALAAQARIRRWPLLVVAWCLIGAGDLILAPLTAVLYGGPRVDDFPMNVIPVFLGPPLGILLHVVTLRALWLQRKLADTAGSGAGPAAASTPSL
jgi:hypothetical protein